MKAPRPTPPLPGRAPPQDTLDDLDLQEDAVHEVTEPFDALREAPTDLDVGAREAETLGPDSRELPTGPAEQRTAPWMRGNVFGATGATTDPERDPWFWPVFVFIVVLVTCIGVFVYQETHKVH